MYLSVKVPHKIILAGSYTVLDGSPALALAVHPVLKLEVSDDHEDLKRKGRRAGRKGETGFRRRVRTLESELRSNSFAREVVNLFRDSIDPELLSSLSISTEYIGFDVKGWGLGSSAAFTAAFTGALYAIAEKGVWRENCGGIRDSDRFRAFREGFSVLSGRAVGNSGFEVSDGAHWLRGILRYARRAHFLAQGERGSGLDVATSVLGGAVYASKCNRPEPNFIGVGWPKELSIIVIKAPFKADSRKMIVRYGDIDFERRYSRELIRAVGKVIRSARSENGLELISSFKELVEVELAWSDELSLSFYLKDIFLPLRELIEGISDNIAVKAHGAGGGDSFCCIFLREDVDASDIIVTLERRGYSARLLDFRKEGLSWRGSL